ncbi:Omp28-related outer membrane protein [Prevotella aurantiaca]|uniref:Omp28-related outer membrane protein n=1 Tax=Prevotella aurantiaca TaxID=596085 RepID=UPI00288A3BD0|nr:Omp28-related outer membrane protein [Prevotella aurantiaca]
MKKLLLSCFAFAMAIVATAQNGSLKVTEQDYNLVQPISSVKFHNNVKATRANLPANQRYMGNYSSDNYNDKGVGFTQNEGKLTLMTPIFKDIAAGFDGGKVVGMRAAIPADGVGAITLKLFTYNTVDGKMDFKVVAEQEVASSKKGWNDVTFTTPYTLDFTKAEGVMLGFTYTQKKGSTPECYAISLQKEGTVVPTYVTMEGSNELYAFSSEKYGNLAVQAIVEKDYPAKDIMLHSVKFNKFTKASSNTKFVVNVSNLGTSDINAYTLVASIDGKQIKEQTITGVVNGTIKADVVEIPTTDVELGAHKIKFAITKVDGAEPSGNTKNDVYESDINFYETALKRQKQLIEQFTAVTCTWCPTGSRFLKQLQDNRHDLAWVALHGPMGSPDPYQTNQSIAIMNALGASGYPMAAFNRTAIEGALTTAIAFNDETFSQAVQMFNQMFEQTDANLPAFVNLEIAAKVDKVANENNDQLVVDVKGLGVKSAANFLKDYVLYVYVTEDGLVSPQIDKGQRIKNYVHNGTFRQCLTNINGDNITWSGDNFDKQFTYTIPAGYKADNMHVVAFVAPKLGDKSIAVDEHVVNQTNMADVVVLTAGIENASIDADNEIVARYNLAGQKIDKAQKGVNIVKYKNGKVVRVVVK